MFVRVCAGVWYVDGAKLLTLQEKIGWFIYPPGLISNTPPNACAEGNEKEKEKKKKKIRNDKRSYALG